MGTFTGRAHDMIESRDLRIRRGLTIRSIVAHRDEVPQRWIKAWSSGSPLGYQA